MKHLTLIASSLALATFAHAQEATKPAPFQVSGYLDLTYQHDFGKPGTGPTINGFGFNNRNDQYRLALSQVDLFRTATPESRFGFLVSLLSGTTADVLHATEPGGTDSYRNFGQAYVTYLTGGKTPLTIDFGKWYTFIGYEGNDSRTNDNYSRSFLFSNLQPNYHTGLRVTAPVSPKLTLGGYAFQGWNEVEDGNDSKSFGISASYTATPKLTATFAQYIGSEGSDRTNDSGSFGGIGFANANTSTVSQSDLILAYQADATTKFVLNGDYASATGRGNWNGVALYAHKQLRANSAAALRLEHVDDTNGLRTGSSVRLHSITATYDWSVRQNLLLRFELRQDYASSAFFNSDSGPTDKRTTISFSQIIKF